MGVDLEAFIIQNLGRTIQQKKTSEGEKTYLIY